METIDLKNNSSTMNTVVQTFIVEETETLIYDNESLEKWHSMVNDLGLKGQTQIAQKEKSPIPFMYLKRGLVNVFETLCPVKRSVEDYSASPIPLEILDLISLSKKEGYFDKLQIWYDDKSPDPVCIGTTYTDFWSRNPNGSLDKLYKTREEAKNYMEAAGINQEVYVSGDQLYLLGKWGDVKQSIEELTEAARIRYSKDERARLEKDIRDAQRDLTDLEFRANERFN